MIEETICEYLNTNASVPWFAMRPPATGDHVDTANAKYGLFEKTNSTKTDHVATSTFAFASALPQIFTLLSRCKSISSPKIFGITIFAYESPHKIADRNISDIFFIFLFFYFSFINENTGSPS